MIKQSENNWIIGCITDIFPGAVYQNTVYDQYVSIETEGGDELVFFDSPPMVASDLRIGEKYPFNQPIKRQHSYIRWNYI